MTAPHRRSAQEQQRFEAALRELFEKQIRFNEVIGLKVESLQPQAPRVRFDMRDELIGHYQYGRLHGGVISSVLDALGGLALMVAISERHPADTADQVMQRFSRMGTIDLRIDFLRQGLGRSFYGTGKVVRLGGRIGSVQMSLENDAGDLIATGSAAFVVS